MPQRPLSFTILVHIVLFLFFPFTASYMCGALEVAAIFWPLASCSCHLCSHQTARARHMRVCVCVCGTSVVVGIFSCTCCWSWVFFTVPFLLQLPYFFWWWWHACMRVCVHMCMLYFGLVLFFGTGTANWQGCT